MKTRVELSKIDFGIGSQLEGTHRLRGGHVPLVPSGGVAWSALLCPYTLCTGSLSCSG